MPGLEGEASVEGPSASVLGYLVLTSVSWSVECCDSFLLWSVVQVMGVLQTAARGGSGIGQLLFPPG